MRLSIVVAIVVLCITSVCFAEFSAGEPVQTGDPGTPAQVVPEPYVAPAPDWPAGIPLPGGLTEGDMRTTTPTVIIRRATTEWQREDKAARVAESSGHRKLARRHRARANELAIGICQLRKQVQTLGKEYKNTQDYLHREDGYFVEMQGAGFITRSQADQRYVQIPPAVPPAGPALTPASTDVPPAETPAGGKSMNESILWTAVIIFGAVAVAWLIWSQILNGIRIARGEGHVVRLEERAYGGNGGNANAQPQADPAYIGSYRDAIGAPRPPAPTGGSLVRGGRYTNGQGQTSSWESWEPDRGPQPAQTTGGSVPGVLNVQLRDLNLVLDDGDQRPFGRSRR